MRDVKDTVEALVDTHAHLDFPEFAGDLPSVLARATEAGVREIVTIGIDIPSSRQAVEIAQTHPQVYATVGIHPHDAFALDSDTLSTLEALARQDRVVAIGEIGLDYYRNYKPRDVQRRCLHQQLEVACAVGLPVVFHIRDAHEEFLEIIQDHVSHLTAVVLHCFSGDWTVARCCLDLGFTLSIPGTVTFPKAQTQQEVVKRAPLDRLLVETDAPYLAPVPYRGKVNEPAYVFHTARKIAELRQCPFDEVARQTTRNARELFGIQRPVAGE